MSRGRIFSKNFVPFSLQDWNISSTKARIYTKFETHKIGSDNQLFITIYDMELNFVIYKQQKKELILSGKTGTLRIIFFIFFMRTVRNMNRSQKFPE